MPAETSIPLLFKALWTAHKLPVTTVTADWKTVADSEAHKNVPEPKTKCPHLWMADLFRVWRRIPRHSRGRNSTAGARHSATMSPPLAVPLTMGGNPPCGRGKCSHLWRRRTTTYKWLIDTDCRRILGYRGTWRVDEHGQWTGIKWIFHCSVLLAVFYLWSLPDVSQMHSELRDTFVFN